MFKLFKAKKKVRSGQLQFLPVIYDVKTIEEICNGLFPDHDGREPKRLPRVRGVKRPKHFLLFQHRSVPKEC